MKVCALCERCYDDSLVSCIDETHPVLSETSNGDPEMIAGYRLDSLLESGARGATYRARQTESGRSCLIKILSAREINSQQFLRDARLAAAFFHPNVVDVYEAGSLDGSELFVVAEDADGKPLRGFLNSVGVPELLTSIEVVRQTAEALDALHRAGLVHRAINPENILLTTDVDNRLLVRIKDLDLGGVIHRSIVSNKFLIDSALDLLRYFAPEQCSGEETGPQADVYSLGIVFYEMLAGRPPFDASKASGLIEKHRSQRPPDVRVDNFDLRMLVTHALMESLQKQPRSRQASANAFARQLRHIEQLATHVSTPPPAGVVPSLPVRSAPRVDVIVEPARPVIRPVVPVLSKEDIQPIAERVEREPIAALNVESGPVQVIDLGNPADEPIAVPELLFEPETQDVAPVVAVAAHRQSLPVRLRLAGLKLREKISGLMTATRASELSITNPILVAEPAEVRPVPVAAALVETPVIQAKTDEIATAINIEPTNVEEEIPTVHVPTVETTIVPTSIEPVETKLPFLRRRHRALARKTRLPSLREERGPASAGGWFSPSLPDEIVVPVTVEPLKIEKPEPINVAEVQKTTIPIGHMRIEDVPVIPKIKSDETYARIPWVKGVLKSSPQKEPIRIPVVRDELEEITLVRARKPIRIDLDRPTAPQEFRRDKMFSFDAADAVRFVPTLLGDTEKRRTIDLDTRDMIFSSYGGQPAPRASLRRRLLAAAGVSVVLIIGFLFADDLGRYLEAASSDDSVMEKTAQAQKSVTPVEPTAAVSASKKTPPTNSKTSQPDGEKESKPAVTKEQLPRSAEPSRTAANPRNVKTSETSKAKSAVKSTVSTSDKKAVVAGNKPVIGTRPRIVAEPRP